MIELLILNFLKDEGFTAYMQMPEKSPSFPFVIIEKTGSSRYNRINTSTIAIQSYADTMYEAAVLNDQVKTAMEEAVGLDEITKVSLNSDYNFTDTRTKRYRYQAVFDITHYDFLKGE